MKTFLRIWLGVLLSLAALSCVRETETEFTRPAATGVVEGQKVHITFDVLGFGPETRTLGEGDGENDLQSLHLAVFGGSGYLKEYAEAICERAGTYTYEAEDTHGNPVSRTVPKYTFAVDLAMSDSPRTVHFMGNGPSIIDFGWMTTVMPQQLSQNGEMGYWQVLSLPDGIRAKRDADGNYLDRDDNIIPEGGTGFVADPATEALFQNIPLIRNWSKIVLSASEDSNFTPYSFAVVNVPSRGAMAPYSADTGFLQNYQNLSFTTLEDDIRYPANLPVGTVFDMTIPPLEAFQPASEQFCTQGVADARTGHEGAVYLYERPAPNDVIPPTFVIIYGHYHNLTDSTEPEGDYFYKVDLMETKKTVIEGEPHWNSRYYPIYRNFKYQILVSKILSKGHDTPAAAAAAAGSADVSADITTGNLSDISDGIGRLHITPWLSQTFTVAHDDPEHPLQVLSAWFGTTDGTPYLDDRVRVELLAPEDGGAPILSNLHIGPASTDEGSKGWRTISFNNVAPGKTMRSQKIRVTGVHDDGRLYRDVTITIQPIQPMSVRCGEERIPARKGTAQTVIIDIPDGLTQSMFPLDFVIEAENMTLTPDNTVPGNNLPVQSGTTISLSDGFEGKPAFQFIRTLTWQDYLELERYEDDEEVMWRSFTSYFLTNRAESASKVWVYNEFFDEAYTSFTHFNFKYFKDMAFTIPIPEAEETSLPMHFEMIEDPDGVYPTDYPRILISLRGLRMNLDALEGLSPGPEEGTYYLKPTTRVITLPLITRTNNPNEMKVDLTALDYEPGHLEPYHFPMVKLLDGHPILSGTDGWASGSWSNVAWGYVNNDNNKYVIIGYKDDLNKLNTPVTVTIIQGLRHFSDNDTTPVTVTPTGPRNANGDVNYHEIQLRSVGGGNSHPNIAFDLSSPGYVTEHVLAGRFVGNIRTMRVTSSNAFKSGNTYGFSQANPSFSQEEDNGKVTVAFSEIAKDPDGKVTFAAGGTYSISITSQRDNQRLFYVDLFFRLDGKTVLGPESFGLSEAGTITRYPGSNNQFVWSIPYGDPSTTHTLSFKAPDNADVVLTTMYIKAFNGTFYKDGITLTQP